jgi:multidrug resistance efflux pump
MTKFQAALDQAARHVREGEVRVARLTASIKAINDGGHRGPAEHIKGVLATAERTLDRRRADLQRMQRTTHGNLG